MKKHNTALQPSRPHLKMKKKKLKYLSPENENKKTEKYFSFFFIFRTT